MNTLEAFDLEPAVEQTAPEYDETSTEGPGGCLGSTLRGSRNRAGFVLAVILKLPTPELTDFALIIQPILADRKSVV